MFEQTFMGSYATDANANAAMTAADIVKTAGMWYFNTTSKVKRVWDGTVYNSDFSADGRIPMSGDLDMGTKDITNVGLVDGSDVSAVAALAHVRAHAMDSGSDHTAGTRGDIPYAGAAGAWSKLAAGAEGKKLTTHTATGDPTWTTGQSQTMEFSQGSDTVGAGVTTYYKGNSVDTGIDECEKPVVLTDSPIIKSFVLNITTNTRPNNTTFTVMKNGVATALAIIVPGLGTGPYVVNGSVACAQGDKIAVQIATGATAGTLSRSCASVLITN